MWLHARRCIPGPDGEDAHRSRLDPDLLHVSRLIRNAPVEVDQILGDLIERGRNFDISTPLLEAACVEPADISGPAECAIESASIGILSVYLRVRA